MRHADAFMTSGYVCLPPIEFNYTLEELGIYFAVYSYILKNVDNVYGKYKSFCLPEKNLTAR